MTSDMTRQAIFCLSNLFLGVFGLSRINFGGRQKQKICELFFTGKNP